MSAQELKFQNGQGSGLSAVVVCAAISLIVINFVWIRLVWVAVSRRKQTSTSKNSLRDLVFFKTQLGAYVVSLFLANALGSFGYILNLAWITEGGITPGSLCTVQGVLTQIGDTATAFFAAAIAVHTFCTLALRNKLPGWLCALTIGSGWILTVTGGVVPAQLSPVPAPGPVYGSDGSFCGISLQYPLLQTLIHLVPIFIASLIAVVFYSVVYLIIRGTLSFKRGVTFTLDPETRWNSQNGPSDYQKFVGQIAKSMLLFPFVYVLLMLPHIVVCLLETSGLSVSFAAKILALSCSALLGVGHVLVFYNILRVMNHALNGSSHPQKKADIESFASPEKSPVDVAPSVAQVLSQKGAAASAAVVAFPVSPKSPRKSGQHGHSRMESMASLAASVGTVGNESTTRLLAPMAPSHSRSASSMTTSTFQRSITPVSELNEILSAEPSAYTSGQSQADSPGAESDADSLVSLPAPRRQRRSPSLPRQPSIVVNEPEPERPLTVVSLASPASARPTRPGRDSFINMYATRHDGRSPRMNFSSEERLSSPPTSSRSPQFRNRTLRPSASAITMSQRQLAAQSFASSFASFRGDGPVSPQSGSSSNFSSPPGFSPGSSGHLPNSPFMDAFIQRASMAFEEPPSPRSEGHYHVPSEVPMSAAIPSLAYTAMRNNATREMAKVESARLKASRRRSKSLDNIRGGPGSAKSRASWSRPERPISPGLRSPELLSALSRQEATSPGASPRGSIKLSSRATLHEGPSKTATVNSNPGTPKPFGYI